MNKPGLQIHFDDGSDEVWLRSYADGTFGRERQSNNSGYLNTKSKGEKLVTYKWIKENYPSYVPQIDNMLRLQGLNS
jgi:hypothetical protein